MKISKIDKDLTAIPTSPKKGDRYTVNGKDAPGFGGKSEIVTWNGRRWVKRKRGDNRIYGR